MAYMHCFIKNTGISQKLNSFRNRSIPQSWGNTLLCLIPKLENAFKVTRFRPLGICNTHYKILTKILANRIKPHFPCLISPFQGAFTPGRHAADLFTVAHETIHSMNDSNNKNGWLILKIYLTKAFDSISWSFVENILHLHKLPQHYIDLLLSCLRNVHYTPIINGIKTTSFTPSRGIRQGDSISSYIFILAM